MSSDAAPVLDVRGAGGELHLVRDLLDKLLVDRHQEPMGRVDGVVLGIEQGTPPQVLWIECGVTVLAERFGEAVARWVAAISRRRGLRRGQPLYIPWSKVLRIGIETELDLDAEHTPALGWEHWLLEHVVRYLPSAKSSSKPRRAQKATANQTSADIDPMQPPPVSPGGALRVHRLLGKKILDVNGHPAGRIEEIIAHVNQGQCRVTHYAVGRDALLERLSITDLSLAALRGLGARHGALGQHVPWTRMDLSDVDHPRLNCPREDLPTAQPPDRQR